MALGIWCYCRISKTVDQTEKTTNIEMKTIYQTDMPTYMHPEAQIKTPDAPPPRTAHKGTSPNISKKSRYEAMADQQIRDDPFQLKITAADIQEANLARQRLLDRLATSE